DILQAGAAKARRLAAPLIAELREAVGLRNRPAGGAGPGAGRKDKKQARARFVSFRDDDGRFRFRLLSAEGGELLVSGAHDDPKQAGMLMRRLQEQPDGVDTGLADGYCAVMLDGRAVALGPAAADDAAR